MEKDSKKTKQYLAAAVSAVAVAAVLFIAVGSCETTESSHTEALYAPVEADSLDVPRLVLKIQKCSRLYSTEYKIRKIITHEDQKVIKVGGMSFDLPLTDRHIAIPLDATLKAYVDMSEFSENNIATNGTRIIVTLPEPKIEVTSAIVQHDKTQEHVALVRQNYTAKEQENLHRQGLISITENAMENGILENARASVARTLVPMLQQMGYEDRNIEVRFSKQEYNLNDLPLLLDSKSVTFNR